MHSWTGHDQTFILLYPVRCILPLMNVCTAQRGKILLYKFCIKTQLFLLISVQFLVPFLTSQFVHINESAYLTHTTT